MQEQVTKKKWLENNNVRVYDIYVKSPLHSENYLSQCLAYQRFISIPEECINVENT